jgi:hypothetical protein
MLRLDLKFLLTFVRQSLAQPQKLLL